MVHSRPKKEGKIAGKWTSERRSVGAIDPEFTAAAAGATDGGTDDVTSDGDWKE